MNAIRSCQTAIFFSTLFLSLPSFSTSSSEFTFYASANVSQLNGYVQIPAGGKPGTSSEKRPTFNELNINDIAFAELGMSYDQPWFGMYGIYQNIRVKSHAILYQALISHRVFIPTETSFNTNNKFDLYRLGIYHKWYFFNDRLAFFPEAEFTFLDFNYEFTIPTVFSQRAFHAATGRIGFGIHYFINTIFSLSSNLASSIPGTSHLQVQTANLDLNVNIFKLNTIHPALFFGVAYERIDFEDAQTFPNHINVTMAPILQVGLRAVI